MMKANAPLFLLFALLALLTACGNTPRAPVSDTEGGPRFLNEGRMHRVNDGETLYSIAWMYDLDYLDLARHNNIGPPYTIYRDQFLRVDLRSGGPRAAPTTIASVGGTGTPSTSTARAPAPVTVSPVTITRSSDTRTSTSTLPERTPLPPPTPIQQSVQTQQPVQIQQPIERQPVQTQQQAPVVSAPAPRDPLAAPPPMAVPGSEPATVVARAPDPPPAVTPSPEPLPAGPIVWSWPASGPIIGRFSAQGVDNKGIDIGGSRGSDVLAAADGDVVFAGSGLLRYGEMIILKHNDQYLSAYAHNSRLLVREGERVRRGQKIAELGSTGINRDMLHFEIRLEGRPVDPLEYLPPR